ncbi:MAG: hypothetical protein ABR548_03030 [Actinomycetota bacterium]|nr:hypothetical protein [Actinomycetota bacterium]
MCRAIFVLAVGPSEEACRRLRAFAGAEAQVIAAANDVMDVKQAAADMTFDVAVIDGRTKDAREIIETLRSTTPGAAIIWIGESAPAGTRASVNPERVADDLSKAILRAATQA